MGNGLAVSDVDLKNVEKEIEAIKTGVGDLTIRMAALVIKTQDDYDRGVILLKEGSQTLKKLDAKQDEKTCVPDSWVKKVKAAFKAIKTPIESGMDGVKEKGKKFLQDEAVRKAKEITKLQAEKAKQEEKAVTADTTTDQAKAVNKAAAIEVKIEQKQEATTGGAMRHRTFRITDANLVPREYLIVDEKKLNSIKGKVGEPFPSVPGVEFFDDVNMAAV